MLVASTASDGSERLVFGTAALGRAYGLARPGERETRVVADADATALIEAAVDLGVCVFDTAPAYGLAEERLGQALGARAVVWTKLAGAASAVDAMRSLDRSLVTLRRPRIELLQWHNWSPDLVETTRDCWRAIERDGRVAALGATTYGPRDACAAIESGLFRVVQVEWNLLNQRVLDAVGAVARERGVQLAARSVYLQGALTDEGRELPPLPTLTAGVARVRHAARELGLSVTHLALRAALDQPAIAYVLVGCDCVAQIETAVSIARGEPLDARASSVVATLDMAGDASADPRTWAKTG